MHFTVIMTSQFAAVCQLEQVVNVLCAQDTRRGRSRGGACRRRYQFREAKSAKFHREPPPFCLLQNNFEKFGKTYLTPLAQ